MLQSDRTGRERRAGRPVDTPRERVRLSREKAQDASHEDDHDDAPDNDCQMQHGRASLREKAKDAGKQDNHDNAPGKKKRRLAVHLCAASARLARAR